MAEQVLEAEGVRAALDPRAGGRLASLRVGDLELLVPRRPNPLHWGCYPMAPWAGRVRHGRFRFRGREHRLPPGLLPPHAIHGTVFTRAWEPEGPGRWTTRLGPDWPFPGRAVQALALAPDALRLRLEVHADAEPFPASLGWHPWWRRRLARGGPARLAFRPRAMYARDAEGLPDGRLVPPPPGPWDDCFVDPADPPTLEWPGALRLRLHAALHHWVVYDEPAHALCVEPMTGPPDALNREPRVVEPGRPLVATLRLAWQRIA